VRTLKLVVAYEGTRYVGWQRQPNGVSIQGLLEKALAPLNSGQPVRLVGAGRTDAGVHARGQVASCRLPSTIDAASILRALNARLPEDVRVLEVSEATETFHARYSAVHKTYAYYVHNADIGDPLGYRFVWHVPQPLDIAAMREALTSLRGTHDFRAFQASRSRVSTTIRTLAQAELAVAPWCGFPLFPSPHLVGANGVAPDGVRSKATLLTFVFGGDGFLRHMVRNLVGTIVEVGLGKREPSSLARLIVCRDRRLAGATAPAQGLVLQSVEYATGPATAPVSASFEAWGPPSGGQSG
jgi:tRNA pseudouridine38-40 synthase